MYCDFDEQKPAFARARSAIVAKSAARDSRQRDEGHPAAANGRFGGKSANLAK